MKWFLFFLVMFVAAHTYGDDSGMDAASQSALQSTDQLLKDRKGRENAAKENARTQQAHDYAKKVGGDEKNVDEMYNLSSDVFTFLTEKYKGDATALQKALLEAQTNPEAFYNSLPQKVKDQVRGLASKVPQATKPQN